MTTPDTTTPEATVEENTAAAAAEAVETEPAAPEATSEAKTSTQAPAAETAAAPAEAGTAVAVAAPATTETAVAAPDAAAEADEEEDPQTTVFSLVTFFLAALPVIGVVLNAIAVARAGKEGFDLWLARWGLALAIVETIGALALVAIGYYFGLLTAGAV